MVGIGSYLVDLDVCKSLFASFLGRDTESWGLSYLGTIQHDGITKSYTTKLERDDVIGIHLDLWHGTLAFYNNGKFCGIAFHDLRNKELYPMISSTAARTKMKLVKSTSIPTSLQYKCCVQIGKCLSGLKDLKHLPLPPGLKRYINNHMAWVIDINSCDNMKFSL